MHETSDLYYSTITFSYTKYFVHSYTVDVVFTLSQMVNFQLYRPIRRDHIYSDKPYWPQRHKGQNSPNEQGMQPLYQLWILKG